MHGICIATRGYICPPRKDQIVATTCDHPVTHTVVEVRPSMIGTYAPEAEEPLPAVAEASPVTPITESVTEEQVPIPEAPTVAEVSPLQPVIVSAEEE